MSDRTKLMKITLEVEALESRFEEGVSADPTEHMSEADKKRWWSEHAKNKDKFTKDAHKSRFDEGVSADPTENMSEADKKKWWSEHEKNKDKFAGWDFDPNILVQQWKAGGPKVVHHDGRDFTLEPPTRPVRGRDGKSILFRYWGEGQPPDFIVFRVAYNSGTDEYDVTVEHYDADRHKTQSRQVDGLGPENFENFGYSREVMR